MSASGESAAPEPSVAGDPGLHPSLLGAVLRLGRVGGHEAAATLVHLVGEGVLHVHAAPDATSSDADPELDLAAGAARASHHGSGPVVRQGHVEGLSRIDRAFVSLLFDGIAHDEHVTFDQIDSFSRRLPWEYWSDIESWRGVVREEARSKHVLGGERRRIGWFDVWDLRGELADEIRRLSDVLAEDRHASPRLVELAAAFGLERRLVSALALAPVDHASAGPVCGAAGLRWLCTPGHAHQAPLIALARAFSPLRAARYAPAQYTRIVLPRWYGGGGPIDDGGTRLGG